MAKKKINANNLDCIEASGISVDKLIELAGVSETGDPLFQTKVARAIKSLEMRKRQAVYRAAAMRRAVKALDSFKGDANHALESFLSIDRTHGASFPSIEGRSAVLFGEANSFVSEMMEHHRPKKLGWSYDKEGLRNMIRELRGQATGDAEAVAFAQAYTKAAEHLRVKANEAGADIGFLKDWGTPQYHESQRVAKVPQEEWVEYITPRLDLERSFEGLLPQEIEVALGDIYKNIMTDGLWRMEPGGMAGTGGLSVANQMGQPRELHYKDAEAWIEYQEKFGSEDLYGALINHLERLGRDVALVQALGPNPSWGYTYLRDMVRKNTGDYTSTNYADKIYANLQGLPRGGNPWFADIMQTGRNIMVASKLHSAMLAAIPDLAFYRQTIAYNGLPQFQSMIEIFKQINPLNKADRILVGELGFIAEAALDRLVAVHRYTESTGTTMSARVANTTMRLSGLQPWTVAIRRSFTLSYMREISRLSDTGWDDLGKNIQSAFKSTGITPGDWNIIRNSPKVEHNGASFASLTNIPDSEIRVKLGALINKEMNYVSPTDSAAVRAITNQGVPAGTGLGEFLRSFMQFKGFAVTQLVTHVSRAMHTKTMNRAVYAGTLLITASMLGYLSVQSKAVTSGKDPRDLDGAMLADSMLAGGVGGILTDLFMAGFNDYFRSFSQFFFGPVPAFVLDDFLLHAVFHNVEKAFEDTSAILTREFGEEVAGDYIRLLRKITPQVWQFKLFIDRAVLDQIELLTDPDASNRFLRKMSREERSKGTEYFWEPGEAQPHRAPEPAEVTIGEG